MKQYTSAENIALLQEELNYFTGLLESPCGEAEKYIKIVIRQINRDIERYSKRNEVDGRKNR